ncbi:MAG TPA: Fic family protein [Acidimicrobiales bacterium]
MAVVGEGSGRGREVPITWNGARLRAWVPALLAGQGFELASVRAVRLTERAAGAIEAAGNRPARFEPVAMLLLRSEGVASSYIEGIRTPLVDVAAAEIGGALSDAASYVADNLTTVVDALRSSGDALTHELLWSWHRALMEQRGGLPRHLVGAYRAEQSWVGGTSPRDAAFVPPPPELVHGLMEDLVAFANDDALDPVTQAAVLHAQFEIIHPFGDGNGRIGRVLIGWLLARRLGVALPPPVSVLIARDPGGYLAGLTLFRLGQLDPWVEWLAAALERSSDAAAGLMSSSETLLAKWRARLEGVRADAAAWRVIEILAERPVVSAALVGERLGISARAGQTALVTLAERGILSRYHPNVGGRGRPTQYWVAHELVALVAGWPGT